MNALEMAGPSVPGSERFSSTCTRPMTVPMMPSVGAKPPVVWKAALPAVAGLHGVQVRLQDVLDELGVGAVDDQRDALPQNGSSTFCVSSSSDSRPSRRAFSAMPTIVLIDPTLSIVAPLYFMDTMMSFGICRNALRPDERRSSRRPCPETIRKRRRDEGDGVAAFEDDADEQRGAGDADADG